MPNPIMSRRSLLATAAAVPMASLLSPSHASAPMLGPDTQRFSRFNLGSFEVTTLLALSTPRPDPHSIFGLNVSDAEFEAVSAAANIPADKATFFFTPTIVNTGGALVMFDAGLDGDGSTDVLSAAGYTPEQIDIVVITHMHPDHIGGLKRGDGPTFPNARYVTGAAEFDAWSKLDSALFDSHMRPLAEQTTMLQPGGDVASGITARQAFGHTPGHMTYRIESDGAQLLIGADFANHYVWSLAYPDWEVKFDMDKQLAAAARRRTLDMLAADKIPFIGYHMPFPSVGYVEKRGDGYAYQPESYQLRL